MKYVKAAHSCTIKIPRTIPATIPIEKIRSISFMCYASSVDFVSAEAKHIPQRKVWKSALLAGYLPDNLAQLGTGSCQIVNDWH